MCKLRKGLCHAHPECQTSCQAWWQHLCTLSHLTGPWKCFWGWYYCSVCHFHNGLSSVWQVWVSLWESVFTAWGLSCKDTLYILRCKSGYFQVLEACGCCLHWFWVTAPWKFFVPLHPCLGSCSKEHACSRWPHHQVHRLSVPEQRGRTEPGDRDHN